MSYTEGLELAIEFGMEELYNEAVENGATPLQAIMEWTNHLSGEPHPHACQRLPIAVHPAGQSPHEVMLSLSY